MNIDLKNNEIQGYVNGIKKTHKPLSTEFREIEILPDGKILVIEYYYKFKYQNFSNLYCLNRNIEIEWFLPFPDNGPDDFDYYVGFSSFGDNIFANSWSCFRVEVDTKNGRILSEEFTK